MTRAEELQRLAEFGKKLRNDPVRLREFMRSVMGPPTKKLEGKEKEQVLLLLELIEPFEQTNNQHSWTDCYRIGNTVYWVTHIDDEVIVDEILEDV